jgi:hypothetical protein
VKFIRPAGLCLPLAILCALAPAARAGSFAFLRGVENPFATLLPAGHGHTAHHGARPAHSPRRAQPYPPRATPSYYIHTVKPKAFRVLGCLAGKRRTTGIVILDFGRLGYNGHSYGTLMFSNRFATNRAITAALQAYARGYGRCLPSWSRARVVLARGTSNYSPHVPSVYGAGRRWARETVALARYLRRHHLTRHVRAAAADDAEPGWDRTFWRTRDFYRGYRSYRPGYLLYDYGSIDGGVGAIWSARQLWYVTGGMRYARPIPEIYYRPMAEQWARLSRIVARRFHRALDFAGLITQHSDACRRCGYRPHEAHRALLRRLPWYLRRRLGQRLPALTNIQPLHPR